MEIKGSCSSTLSLVTRGDIAKPRVRYRADGMVDALVASIALR